MKSAIVRLLAIICFASALFAQSDITNGVRGAYLDAGRSLVWGASGGVAPCQSAQGCGIQNNFIFTPLNPDQGICIFVSNNNPTNQHFITVSVFQTGDPRQYSYNGNTGRFVQDTVQGGLASGAAIPAGSTQSGYVHTNAAARFVLSISGTAAAGGSPDTADIYIVQTSATTCGPVAPGNTLTGGNANSGAISYWYPNLGPGYQFLAVDQVGRSLPLSDGESNSTWVQQLGDILTIPSISNTHDAFPPEYGFAFNGLQWDRVRNNYNSFNTDTGTFTASFNGATVTNFNNRGIWFTTVLGTVSGTTPTLAVQMQYSVDGVTFFNLGPASATLTATGQSLSVIIYPSNMSTAGATPAALTVGTTQTLQLNAPIPRIIRAAYTITGTTPSFAITTSIYNYMP